MYICPNPTLLSSALGFLCTYTKLIQHFSDFTIAIDFGFLPTHVTWPAWNLFRTDLCKNIQHPHQINKRFIYGELRLSRLNEIYRIHQRSWREGYFLIQSFFKANFAWLMLVFAYLSVVLSAMQVLLGANQVPSATSKTLVETSVSFGTAAIVLMLLAIPVMISPFLILKSSDETYARRRKKDGIETFKVTSA